MITLLQEKNNSETQQLLFQIIRFFIVFIGFVFMLAQVLYIEIFYNCLKFETSDYLAQKDFAYKFISVYLRIFMVIISFLLKGDGTIGIFRDILNCFILLSLLVKHYQDFPFKNKFVQKLSGGLTFWLFFVSVLILL